MTLQLFHDLWLSSRHCYYPMYFHSCNDPPGVPDLHFSMGVRLVQPLFFREVSTIAILFVCLISFDNCAVVLRRITASDWPFDIPHFFSNAIYPMSSVAFKLCVPVPKATLSI